MSAKDQYNRIINQIEDDVSIIDGTSMDASVLAEWVAKQSGTEQRALSAIINFMTGKSPIAYIRERQLMASYKYLISSENAVINKAVEIAHYDNQSSFTKKFSAKFKISPREAVRRKDLSLLLQPLTWEAISNETTQYNSENEESQSMSNEQIFGVPQEQYLKFQEAMDLEALYGMSRVYSNIAFSVAEQCSIPLKEAFYYVDSILTMFQETEDAMNKNIQEHTLDYGSVDDAQKTFNIDDIVDETDIQGLAFSPVLQYLCINCNVSASFAILLIQSISFAEEDLLEIQPDIIHNYLFYDDMDFAYYLRAMNYYLDHIDEDYEYIDMRNYMDSVDSAIPIEIAFSSLIPQKIREEEIRDAMNSGFYWDDETAILTQAYDERMAKEREGWEIGSSAEYTYRDYNEEYYNEDDDFYDDEIRDYEE